MTRASLSKAILGKQSFHGIVIAELDHPDGVIRLHSGPQDIFIGGTRYTGAEGLLRVEGVEDGGIGGDPHTWTMGLSGASPMLAAKAVEDSLLDRGVRLSVSVSDDGDIWETPEVIKVGRISSVIINAENITVECVTATFDLSRVRQRNTQWTHAQQTEYVDPNDQTFSAISAVLEKEISWP